MVAAFQLGMVGWLLVGAVPIVLLNQQQQKLAAIGSNENHVRPSWGGKKTNQHPAFKLPKLFQNPKTKKYLHGAAWLLPSVLSMNFHTVKSTSLAMLGIRVLFLEIARRGKAASAGGVSVPALAALIVPTLPGLGKEQEAMPNLKATALASAMKEEEDDGKWWITRKLVGNRKRPKPGRKQTKWSLTSSLTPPQRELVAGRKPPGTPVAGRKLISIEE